MTSRWPESSGKSIVSHFLSAQAQVHHSLLDLKRFIPEPLVPVPLDKGNAGSGNEIVAGKIINRMSRVERMCELSFHHETAQSRAQSFSSSLSAVGRRDKPTADKEPEKLWARDWKQPWAYATKLGSMDASLRGLL